MYVFVFKQKTAYEMRISDWSSDVCSSDLINPDLKLTAGLRYTKDRKTFTPVPSQLLLAPTLFAGGAVGRGYPAEPDIKLSWGEFTGRAGVDWQPDLGFTDQTLLYAFYSRGYKAGGMNPPTPGFARSEEHTSELQSLMRISYAVFCLKQQKR